MLRFAFAIAAAIVLHAMLRPMADSATAQPSSPLDRSITVNGLRLPIPAQKVVTEDP